MCALAQTNVDVQVVVVDDGSVDGTGDHVSALGDPRVRVLRRDRPQGVSAARNLGLQHVRAPWVAFLDDDDLWAPGYLATMLDAVRGSDLDPARVGLAFSGHITLDAGWNVTQVSPAPSEDAARGGIASFNSIGCPSRVLARTEAVREAGGFDERLAIVADWDLWLRILAGYELVRSPEMLVGYMIHGANMHLDGDRFVDELGVMQARHGEWRAPGSRAWARATRPGDMMPAFVAAAYRARGRRLRAARWYLRSFWVYGERRDLRRAMGVLLGERAIDRLGLRERIAIDPMVGRWIGQVRQLAATPASDPPPAQAIHPDGPEAP